jgi:hypothetical protein
MRGYESRGRAAKAVLRFSAHSNRRDVLRPEFPKATMLSQTTQVFRNGLSASSMPRAAGNIEIPYRHSSTKNQYICNAQF